VFVAATGRSDRRGDDRRDSRRDDHPVYTLHYCSVYTGDRRVPNIYRYRPKIPTPTQL